MPLNPTQAILNNRTIPDLNCIPDRRRKPSQSECSQQVTIESYQEVASSISGNPPEKSFILAYFETLQSGKLPTFETVKNKYKRDKTVNIEELLISTNHLLGDMGYKPLELFPKADKDLADIYTAFKQICERAETSTITIEDISREAKKNLNHVTKILTDKDSSCSRLTQLDPEFGKVFDDLWTQAATVRVARINNGDALEEAHKWQADSGTLEFAREFIRESLGPLAATLETADQYAFMISQELGEIIEPGSNVPDSTALNNIRAVKLAKLFHALEEIDGINENTLKIAWCYSKVKDSSNTASTKALLGEVKTQTGTDIDLTSLIDSLRILEKFTGQEFSIDLFNKVRSEVKNKAKFAPKEFNKFKDVIYKNIVANNAFKDTGITEAAVSHILETVVGITKQDYTVYKACQELADKDNAIRKDLLAKLLKETDIKITEQQIGSSLSVIKKVFGEEFNSTTLNTATTPVTVAMLDQKARRERGFPLAGHYQDPINLKK